MAYALSQRSLDRLAGVNPDLVRVIKRAITISPIDFTVLEGLRTIARQRQLVASGASTTMNSRHLTGHAVDIAPLVNGAVSWNWPDYYKLAPAVKEAARLEGVPIEWGGDWRSFKDGPHWQLPWSAYDATDTSGKAAPITNAVEPAESGGAPTLPDADMVTTANLNVRTAPLPAGGTVLRTLPKGTEVETVEHWALVRFRVDGAIREGWVAGRFLDPLG